MASVFLSYAREDAAKAKALTAAIERAGHDVWWDRHIRSGSEFAGAIEEALKRADAVLVLWSEGSVCSPWVRDEAAEGRDSGRLVAAVLDASRPPIGFRQFQSTDLSSWSGKGTPRQFDELLGAIAEKRPNRQGPEGPQARAPAKASIFASRRFRILGAVGAVLVAVLLIAAAWLYAARDSASTAEIPTLAVLPFADLSPQRDKAYFSEGVAEEILSVLARDPGIRVIGRSSARQFQDSSSDLQGIRKALGVTHVLEGSARTSGDELRMSVRLINASDGRQLWAENYQRKMSNIFTVQAEIGRAVAERLSGSLSRGVREAKPQSTGADTYNLYLAARSKMRERTEPALKHALQLAERVVAADPNYAPGHALLAELIWLLSEENYGNIPIEKAREFASRYAARAIKLAPGQAEGYAALGTVPPVERAVAALRKAIELDLSRSELRVWLGAALHEMGRNEAALEQFRAAVAMEPIWPTAVRNLVNTLAASGQYQEAGRAVAEFESRGGGPAEAALMRSQNAWAKGDLSEAARYSQAVARSKPELLSSFQQPLLFHDLGLFARAASLAKSDSRLRLFVSGKYRELAQLVQTEGLWGQQSAWLGLDTLAVTRDWAAIETLYDGRPASARDLCRHPIGAQGRIHLATGLIARGRGKEARSLLDCVRKNIDVQSSGPVRSFYYSEMYLAALSAQLLALEKNEAAAFQEMNRGYRLGLWTPHSSGLSFYPAFDPYRATREYRELEARFKQRTAAERQQLMRP